MFDVLRDYLDYCLMIIPLYLPTPTMIKYIWKWSNSGSSQHWFDRWLMWQIWAARQFSPYKNRRGLTEVGEEVRQAHGRQATNIYIALEFLVDFWGCTSGNSMILKISNLLNIQINVSFALKTPQALQGMPNGWVANRPFAEVESSSTGIDWPWVKKVLALNGPLSLRGHCD